MEEVISTFKSYDTAGDGLVSYSELAVLLQMVDATIDEEKFKVLMEDTGMSPDDKIEFEKWARWLDGAEVPPIVKAAAPAAGAGATEAAAEKSAAEPAQDAAATKSADEPAQDPKKGDDDASEASIDDEEDMDDLALELELECADLDLDQKINRKEWVAIMGEMDVEPEEASEQFDNITEECVREGLGDAESGFPLREFLEDLKVEVEDIESLKAIALAATEAKKKMDKGEEKKVGDAPGPQQTRLALDKIVRVLDKAQKPAEESWDYINAGKVPLSSIQKKAVAAFESNKDDLVKQVRDFMQAPPLVNAAAGQNACRELCVAEVGKIIEAFTANGTKFTDPEWDLTSKPNEALYVDKEKPGWDCTVAKPHEYKRLSEIVQDPVLFKGGIRAGDIIQGQIGTCFLLGAMGAIVSNNENAIRKSFLRHDCKAGVYGVRFCLDGEWTYVVVDDWMPVDQYGNILYARSKDPQEVWCPILEKAYCKLHACYEMCDGGFSTEAIFNFFGGVSGTIAIKDEHLKNPASYFKLLKQGRQRGWLLTVHFAPKKGKQSGDGKGGNCGEAIFDSGLVGGHCYSVLKVVDACGQKLVCCRNPWGTGEWKGKFSDENAEGEWTDEMKEATGYTGLNDGKFWMSLEDFLQNSEGVSFARTFGPDWKKITQYKHFQQCEMLATAKKAYEATADDEISFDQGEQVRIKSMDPYWWYGRKEPDGDKDGYFPFSAVRLNDRPVARFDLVANDAGLGGEMKAVVILMLPDAPRQRKFYQRREDGMNYKDNSYPCTKLCIINPAGKVQMKKTAWRRCLWGEVNLAGGGQWRIYAYQMSGQGGAFSLRVYLKGVQAQLQEVPGADIAELGALLAAS